MILLQVQTGALDATEGQRLMGRFGKFFDAETGVIEYPVSCDSHGMDVFADELEGRVQIDHAAIIELPYDYDGFTPFSEESAGVELATYEDEPGDGWKSTS